jgi:hypothetical protein
MILSNGNGPASTGPPAGTGQTSPIASDTVAQSPYLTTEQVAERYHASVRAVRDWVAAGHLPYTRRPYARRLLYLRAHLDAYDAGAELEHVELPDGGVVVRPLP